MVFCFYFLSSIYIYICLLNLLTFNILLVLVIEKFLFKIVSPILKSIICYKSIADKRGNTKTVSAIIIGDKQLYEVQCRDPAWIRLGNCLGFETGN